MDGGDGRGGALDMGSAPLETSSGSAPGMYVCMYVWETRTTAMIRHALNRAPPTLLALISTITGKSIRHLRL